MKDQVILSRKASSQDDFTLQLSRMSLTQSDMHSIVGNPETEACQRLVMRFLELHQLVCSKISSQEREISSYESHITALKNELQDACLRERNSCIPDLLMDCYVAGDLLTFLGKFLEDMTHFYLLRC
ncbi:coiled-coil domain-containing protein 171 [Labeo rohita]|uniref:Coiled-coil domain-containing protein 171 n=1 Tax=Labeo rohita TaxID=84645 RepID=A0A498LSU0_LABRO|nr:coiled-coil domain-containing protein 171 [Labeo rohita]